MTADHAGSFGCEVAEWSAQYLNIELMDWQRRVLDAQLSFDDVGDFVHRTSLVSTARQNGKTVALAALVGWWLCNMGDIRDKPQTVLSTAHRLDLAVMLYDYLAPILQKRFNAKVMASYGRNSVTMPDGSRWFIRAANNSVGHGMSASLIVADECWDIGRDVVDGGLLPAQRAQRSPLLSMWSTAGTEASTAMLRWREQGLRQIDKHEPSTLYFAEWSPPPDLSPMNPQAWPYANPALGTTLDIKTIESESENPDRISFLRASCNLWVASDKSWIQPGVWTELQYTDPMPAGGVVAIESSLTDERYFGVRSVVLQDRRTVVTVAFVADTYDMMVNEVNQIAKDQSVKFAISPSIDIHWPTALERRRIVVGYAEILKFNVHRIRSMIHEKLVVAHRRNNARRTCSACGRGTVTKQHRVIVTKITRPYRIGALFGLVSGACQPTYDHRKTDDRCGRWLVFRRATVDALLSRLRIGGRLYTTHNLFGGILSAWAYLIAPLIKRQSHRSQLKQQRLVASIKASIMVALE